MRILAEHQRKGVVYARSKQHPALFWEMRLRKTATMIRVVKTYKPSERERVLVVAPFSAWAGWKSDLALDGIVATPLEGSSKQRLKILANADKGWFITNYESQRGIGLQLSAIRWDVVILDESDSIKNPTAKATKFYIKNFRTAKHRAILTGTPAVEGELGYWGQLCFLDPEIVDHLNYFTWRRKWFYLAGFKWKLQPKKRSEFLRKLGEHCSFLTLKDVNLGSEHITTQRIVQMDDKMRKVYETVQKEFILESIEDNIYKSTEESFATYVWLRQLSSGLLDGVQKGLWKINELLSLLNGQLAGTKVLVWCVYKAELKAVSSALSSANISHRLVDGDTSKHLREEYVADFQDGGGTGCTVLLANPEVLKYGVDASISDTMIWCSLPASGKTFLQASARTTKIGKTTPVFSIMLLTEGTVDELMLENLEQKDNRQDGNHYAIKRLKEKYGL